jgi:hypothetical protein
MDLGRLPPFQRARQISARDGSGLTRRARRDDDQERHDWAQWDERTNDRPHRPSPSMLIGGPRLRLD